MVIDNDNLSQVVDDVESRHLGTASIFSLDVSGTGQQVSSPDVTCSLSFSAASSSQLSDPAMLNELPPNELAKLDGPATIDGDSLQVTVHNGSAWELREVLIGLTVVKHPGSGQDAAYVGKAKVVPAVAGTSETMQDSFEKPADTALLLRVRGAAAPSATAIFRTSLNFELFPDQEWHWAILKAKGVPPPVPIAALVQQPDQPDSTGNPAISEPIKAPLGMVSTQPLSSIPVLPSLPLPEEQMPPKATLR
jgi:hypothetical protein